MLLIRRRDFISLLSGAAAWPIAARAQQLPVPVIGFLGTSTAEGSRRQLAAFREGLNESGFIEGRNVAVEFRWADNQYDRLPALAADLVQRHVAVIVVAFGAPNTVFAAKAATATIPIVFGVGSDPVQLGLVASLARPGGNLTGVTSLARELLAKRLEILRELVPNVTAIGLLVNPNNANAEPSVRELEQLARAGAWALHVAAVTTESDLDTAIATLVRAGAGAFLQAADPLLSSSSDQIVTLANRYRVPAIYTQRSAVEYGGLMSYGNSLAEEYRLIGQYAGRILKGEKPADMPVQQAIKVELVINLKTAKALGLTFPLTLLGRADEVIE
jgi:putative ABC transport system substrate-binding protein